MMLLDESFNENNRCITLNLNSLTNLSLKQVKSKIGGKRKHKKVNDIDWSKIKNPDDIDMPGF